LRKDQAQKANKPATSKFPIHSPRRLSSIARSLSVAGRGHPRASLRNTGRRDNRATSERTIRGTAARCNNPKDRDTLAHELQKELKRVGCYEGELNGAWTPLTRRAMKAFIDRVNATLPVDEPDAILFAMVQGQQHRVCGKPCPSGQGFSEDGRCLPNAILAKAAKKGPLPIVVALSPKSNPAPAEKPAVAVAGWSTVTTAAAPVPARVVASAPALGPPPVEGRMALAGPTPPPTRARVARRAPPPRAAVQQVSPRNSWARSMYARRFDSLN
jgi:hypothetical protein